MKLNGKLGKKIRKERKIRGWVQEEFANEIGMSPCSYGKIERGESNMSVNTLERIAKGLKMKPSELFDFDDDDEG